MNILVLNYEFPPIGGGASPVSYDISREYVRHGHNVHVVTMKYGNLSSDEIVEGMSIHRVKCLRSKQFVCHPWEQMTYIISAIFYLNKYLKNHKADFVHSHFVIPTGVIAWYLNKKRGLRYILTAHGSDTPGHNNARFGLLYKMLMGPWRAIVNKSDYIVSPSNYLKNLICKNMIDSSRRVFDTNKAVVITNGVNTSRYYVEKKDKIILIMGRLQETKGVQDILESIDEDLLGDWVIEIAGEGPYYSELQNIVTVNGLQSKVCFLGWIDSEKREKYDLLARSAIYISGSHFENCPVTLMEAYCSGCHMILSDINGHREIVGDKAIYFQAGDKKEIRNSLLRAMSLYDRDSVSEIDKAQYDWASRVLGYERLMCIENTDSNVIS